LCFGKTKTAAVTPTTFTGKRIWLTNTEYQPGSMTPDQKCMAERPAGISSAVAFIAYDGQLAEAVLDPNASYVRNDGQLVGSGAQLGAGNLLTGIWQTASGTYPSDGARVWTGKAEPFPPRAVHTCNDWTSSSPSFSGAIGNSYAADTTSWFSTTIPCDETGGLAGRLYCVEP
jgi:hypothetical protein